MNEHVIPQEENLPQHATQDIEERVRVKLDGTDTQAILLTVLVQEIRDLKQIVNANSKVQEKMNYAAIVFAVMVLIITFVSFLTTEVADMWDTSYKGMVIIAFIICIILLFLKK